MKGAEFELTGFVWFQGFNDQFGDSPGQYEENMKHFIKDVRKDLKAPNLPFVIAAIGTTDAAFEPDAVDVAINGVWVCRNGMPNSTFMVRQVWIAASLKLGCPSRLPVGGGVHTMSGSNHTVSEPRRLSA